MKKGLDPISKVLSLKFELMVKGKSHLVMIYLL
jgi:hypothetical protein